MYLTLEETKKHFRVKDNRTIIKFTQQGLKFIKIGTQYRFDFYSDNGTLNFYHYQYGYVTVDISEFLSPLIAAT